MAKMPVIGVFIRLDNDIMRCRRGEDGEHFSFCKRKLNKSEGGRLWRASAKEAEYTKRDEIKIRGWGRLDATSSITANDNNIRRVVSRLWAPTRRPGRGDTYAGRKRASL